MVRQYWSILKPFQKVFRTFLFLLILYEGLQVVEGYLMSLVIRMFGSDAQLFVWIGLFIGLLVYDELFMRLDNAMDWHIITKHTYPIYKHLKLGAIQKFLEMDVTWHQKHNSGTLVGKVADGVEKVRDILDGLSWEFVPTFIQIILSFIPLLLFSPPTAGIALIAFLAFGWLSIKSNKQKQVYRSKRHDLYEEEWHRSIEAVQGHETLLMFGQTNHVLSGLEELHDKVISLGQKEAYVGIFKYNRYRIRILTLARRAILAILVWQLYSGSLDIAGIIFINVLTEKLINSFWRFARLLDRASEASEGAKRLADLMVEKAHYIESDNTAVCIPSHQIEMENVCFGYGGNYSEEDGALHKFSLTIDAGKITAIVGPSGAGKTTIRKLITGEIPIISGKIKLGGVDIRHLDKKALLSQFSYVPQGDDVVIFAGSVKENIAFPRPSASMDEIIHAAKLAGIHETIMEMTNKYEEKVGERGKRLSGGQKQRIALARAILAERPILILDEATSAVDTLTERVIQTNMQDILQGKTAIVIAHRLSTIKNANKIVVMDQGCKIEEGSHEELIRKEGLYAQMVASQDLS